MPDDRLDRLKGLGLFAGLPPEKMAELARLLELVPAKAGEVIVKENSVGDCMYIVATGEVRIEKRIPTDKEERYKELAILMSGEFFGEMALIEDQARSARVVAAVDSELFRLDRDDLFAWLENQPQMSIAFFKTLVKTLSHRLRATSRELTMLYDLATVFLEDHPSEKALIYEVVANMVHYFEGTWTVAGYLFNEFNSDVELAAAEGAEAELVRSWAPPAAGDAAGWRDDRTLMEVLPGPQRVMGFLVLISNKPLTVQGKEDINRVAQTVAKLVVSALLNINHKVEEELRTRLKNRAY
jgi:CRP/FNR family cyclic AMP-dependent transcriptional regulator